MERIRHAFIKHAAPGVEFVDGDTPWRRGSVIHCLNWIGQNPKEHTKRCEQVQSVPTLPLTARYLIFAHIGNPHYQHLDHYYQVLMRGAELVICYDKRILGYEGPNIFETPWGFDPETFYFSRSCKVFKILCTGYMADAEAIDACMDACAKLRVKLCHVGGRLKMNLAVRWYARYEGVSDHRMRQLYSASEFVSGMRREGGFELPVIEGYACGCQPIVFNHPTMRKYYQDFALFTAKESRRPLAERLTNIMRVHSNIEPNPEVLKRFHWGYLMNKIWERILEERMFRP